MPAELIVCGDPAPGVGGEFERECARVLRDSLPVGYVISTNVNVPRGVGEFYEYDAIITAPGISDVLEMKCVRPEICVGEDQIVSSTGFTVDRILSKLDHKGKVLRTRLEKSPFPSGEKHRLTRVHTQVVVPSDCRITFSLEEHKRNKPVFSLAETVEKYRRLASSSDFFRDGTARLEIRNSLSPQASILLITNERGKAALPDLPAGSYWMAGFLPSTSNASLHFDFCVDSCPANELVETEMLLIQNLNGTLQKLDRSAAASREVRMDLAPDRDPGWAMLINRAETTRVAVRLHKFHLLVEDPTTAFIPGAMVSVVRKGPTGQETILVGSTDAAGKFAGNLPAGDYCVVVSAQGFVSQAVPVSIDPEGVDEDFQVHLNVGSTT